MSDLSFTNNMDFKKEQAIEQALEQERNLLSMCTYTGNNSIITEYMQKPDIVGFLVDNACYSIKSGRVANIFTPIPETWKRANIEAQDAIKHFNLCTDSDKIIIAIQTSKNDANLLEKIGEHTYGFIKFVISSNQAIGIEKYKLLNIISSSTDADSAEHKKTIQAISKLGQYKFNYTQDIEAKFTDKFTKTIYLYHGSIYENWYSIMRSGIKIGSNNKKLFLNGAVHGNGIYLSNDINMSLSYCASGSNKVLAIYEVVDNPKWKKTENIFVIDDENALILRYIIILNNFTIPQTVCLNLNTKLSSGQLKAHETKKAQESDKILSKAYSKRLMIEYKKLAIKSPEELGFIIKLSEDSNLRSWQILMHKINNTELEKQMTRLNIPYIEMEFTFPDGYPIEPPFIRVVYPHFISQTGHITIGGSICMEAVSKSGWVPSTSVEALILQVNMILSEGKAKIDTANYHKRYDITEAKEAFARAMTAHGW